MTQRMLSGHPIGIILLREDGFSIWFGGRSSKCIRISIESGTYDYDYASDSGEKKETVGYQVGDQGLPGGHVGHDGLSAGGQHGVGEL